MKYFINVLRLENYNIDKLDDFSKLAIPLNKKKILESISVDDYVTTFVSSKISAFCVIRQVKDITLKSGANKYDVPILGFLECSPIISLPRDYWVDARSLINELSFIKYKKYWMNNFLNSLFQIQKSDFDLILLSMRESLTLRN